MVVTLAEISLGDGDFAVGTVAELDPGVAACVVGTNELLAMLDGFGDDKIGSLQCRAGHVDFGNIYSIIESSYFRGQR